MASGRAGGPRSIGPAIWTSQSKARTSSRTFTAPSICPCSAPFRRRACRRHLVRRPDAAANRLIHVRRVDMLGKLTWQAIPFDQPIPLVAGGVVFLILVAVVIWIIVKGHLPYLWNEWITSVDHKRIGVMYMLLSLVMLLRGFIDGLMMRSQQALAFRAPGYLPPEHFDQVFSAHGTIMIFFGAM